MRLDLLPRPAAQARFAVLCTLTALWASLECSLAQSAPIIQVLPNGIISVEPGERINPSPMPVPFTEGIPGVRPPGVTNAPASPEEQRLQELLQLQYDRRPQEI